MNYLWKPFQTLDHLYNRSLPSLLCMVSYPDPVFFLDPDPVFNFFPDPDPVFKFFWIRIWVRFQPPNPGAKKKCRKDGIRIRFVRKCWIRNRSISDRIRSPAPTQHILVVYYRPSVRPITHAAWIRITRSSHLVETKERKQGVPWLAK